MFLIEIDACFAGDKSGVVVLRLFIIIMLTHSNKDDVLKMRQAILNNNFRAEFAFRMST